MSSQHAFAFEKGLEKVRSRIKVKEYPDLPFSNQKIGFAPNSIIRSALFAASRKKRYFRELEEIVSLNGISICYTGPCLDQSDLDVWLQILYQPHFFKEGRMLINFTEKGFLRALGRGGENGKNLGKGDKKWVRKVFARLKTAALEISHGEVLYSGSLVDEYSRDVGGVYKFTLNPKIVSLFAKNNFTFLDLEVRKNLIGYPLAKWIHAFYSSHSQPFHLTVETLIKLSGSENKNLNKWVKESLEPALKKVEMVSAAVSKRFAWRLENGRLQVVHRLGGME